MQQLADNFGTQSQKLKTLLEWPLVPLDALPPLLVNPLVVLLLKFFVYFLCIFNTLPCILLLSLCFGSACPPLTLLQLRYILWCFIVYFRIISRDLTWAFQSGV